MERIAAAPMIFNLVIVWFLRLSVRSDVRDLITTRIHGRLNFGKRGHFEARILHFLMPRATDTVLRKKATQRIQPSRSFSGPSSTLSVGADNLHPATQPGVDRQAETVQLYDRGHQVQPKADTRRVSYLVGTVEPPQHGLALLLADAAAGIRHAHDGFAVTAEQFDV